MLHRAPVTSRPGPDRVPSESLAQEFGSPAQRTTALFLRSRAAQSISIPTLEELKMNLKLISAAVTATMDAFSTAAWVQGAGGASRRSSRALGASASDT